VTRALGTAAAAIVAIALTFIAVFVEAIILPNFRYMFYDMLVDPNLQYIPPALEGFATALVWTLPEAVLAVGLFALLGHYWVKAPEFSETRCRVCGYILRGLSEPRCSECGQQI